MRISFNPQLNSRQYSSFSGVSANFSCTFASKMEGEVVSRTIKILDKKAGAFFDAILTKDLVGGAKKECYFNLYAPNKRRLGTITVMDTFPTQQEERFNIPNMLEYYKNSKMKHKILELDFIENYDRQNYANVGARLVDVAIQESIHRGFHGHVVARSAYVSQNGVVHDLSVPFFYKLGFRSNDITNKNIESVWGNRMALNKLADTPFYLPDAKRLGFIEKFDKEPVFELPYSFSFY